MKKKNTSKVFLKVFKIVNDEGKFTNEDFERLKEKFEIIRKVYFHENENHDYFDSFRSITKEIKRAAHNAGLKAEIIKLAYKTNPKKAELINISLEDVDFNLFILIKSAAKFTRENDFVVTTVQGLNTPILLQSSIVNEISYKVTINDDMRDESDITYLYLED